MLTPQEVQEKTFVKAVFGGYDMATVDDFIDALSADYNTLYNENTVLKNRMKVLVDKLEEYRSQEDSMKKALLAAQRTADELVVTTQQKCARAMQDAQSAADDRMKQTREDLAEEEAKVAQARRDTDHFISQLQGQVSQLLEHLEGMKNDGIKPPAPQRPKAYDFESEADDPAALAKKIEQSVEKIVGPTEPEEAVEAAAEEAPAEEAQPETPAEDETKVLPTLSAMDRMSESARLKFNAEELQFGANYAPKG